MNDKGNSYIPVQVRNLRNPTVRNEMRIRRKEDKKSHQKMRKG
ncbi:hypothetical protein PEC106568_07390 [Pectobacterium carotovorum subsp. carotovorum]|nr:hypothetical protein PEC106568_07390 [Pectobacterium carotovorum subsp. carotovorum]